MSSPTSGSYSLEHLAGRKILLVRGLIEPHFRTTKLHVKIKLNFSASRITAVATRNQIHLGISLGKLPFDFRYVFP